MPSNAFSPRCMPATVRSSHVTTCPSLSSTSSTSVIRKPLSTTRERPAFRGIYRTRDSFLTKLRHPPPPTYRQVKFRHVSVTAAVAPSASGILDSIATSHVSSLLRLHPLVLPHWPQVVKAWLCSALAVSSLLCLIPQLGELTALLGSGDFNRLVPKALFALFLVAVRSISQYWQDVWLWEVALEVTLSLREQVFARVQDLDLSTDTATGDMAFRLTQEAEDAGDIVFSFLHVNSRPPPPLPPSFILRKENTRMPFL